MKKLVSIPLEGATLCQDCSQITTSTNGQCVICTSKAILSLSALLNRENKNTERITREAMMMAMCRLVAQRGTCQRAKVGCVIEREGRIISTGYNGSAPGQPHCIDEGCLIENDHCIRTTHAEANAIAYAARNGISTLGATLYTAGWAKGICSTCEKLALSAGVIRIITDEMR